MDTVSATKRSDIMARVRHYDTAPELTVRSLLHRAGLRFRTDGAGLRGRPDVVLPRWRIAIFVHGCFWHGHNCRRAKLPATNLAFWAEKQRRNRERDRVSRMALQADAWEVYEIWTCALDAGVAAVLAATGKN